MFLLNQWIIFLLTCINFTITQYLISCILFFNRLYLTLIHMIIHYYSLFLKIYWHFSYLFFSRKMFISLPLLTHLKNLHSPHMIVIVKIIFSSINTFSFIFHKCYTATSCLVIFILIELCCFLTYLFNSFY
jgi:hypothetical protein